MGQEELVLERLSGLESQMKYLVDATKDWQELKSDLTPIIHDAVKTLMKELATWSRASSLRTSTRW